MNIRAMLNTSVATLALAAGAPVYAQATAPAAGQAQDLPKPELEV